MLDSKIFLGVNSWFNNFFIFSKNWFWFFKLNMNVFSTNLWSCNFLCVVNISWSFNNFFSNFFLNNWFLSNWLSIDDFIISINPLDFKFFFFNNWLYNSLINIFVWSNIIISVNVVSFNLIWFIDWFKNSLNIVSWDDFKLFGYSMNLRRNNIIIVDFVSIDIIILSQLFLCVFSFGGNWIFVDQFIFSFSELRYNCFNLLWNFWNNYDLLSNRFDNLFGNNLRWSNNSFSNNFWLSSDSLSYHFGFNSNVFSLNIWTTEIITCISILYLTLSIHIIVTKWIWNIENYTRYEHNG